MATVEIAPVLATATLTVALAVALAAAVAVLALLVPAMALLATAPVASPRAPAFEAWASKIGPSPKLVEAAPSSLGGELPSVS